MSAVAMQLNDAVQAKTPQQKLRTGVNEFIGIVMFDKIMSQARESCLNSDLLHSSAEGVFRNQLDDVLLRRATANSSGSGMFGKLGEAIYQKLSKSLPTQTAKLDTRA